LQCADREHCIMNSFLICTVRQIYYCYYYYYYYCSTALCRALAAFSVSWSYTQSVGLTGRGISPSQGLYLYTEQHKHCINSHNTDIHALSWIRTHDLSVRPRGHCDRPPNIITMMKSRWMIEARRTGEMRNASTISAREPGGITSFEDLPWAGGWYENGALT
jgi:hypothetical protein